MDEKTQESGPELATTDFVTVFEGNPAEAQVLQTVLEDQGFDVLVANHTIKTVDPFITGPGMFDMTLQVPAGQAAEASAALRLAREQRGTNAPDEEKDEEGTALESEGTSPWDGNLAGRRLRWGSALLGVLVLIPPIAMLGILLYAFFYIDYNVRSQRLESPPAQHNMTKASVILVVGWAILTAMSFFNL